MDPVLAGLIGATMGCLVGLMALRSYKRTLVYCAEGKSAEKLVNGKFYYLVPEHDYNTLSMLLMHEANPTFPMMEEPDTKHSIKYEAVRYISGYTAEYVQRFAKAYAATTLRANGFDVPELPEEDWL
jgi:hypothetical protein